MRVIKIEPRENPVAIDIDYTLESLQQQVGGCIEAIYPFKESVAIICNEEGKLGDFEPNRILFDCNEIKDVIYGTFLVVGIDGMDFSSLTKEYEEKFIRLFNHDLCLL